MSYTAKSVILDMADNHGSIQVMGLRSVDFWFEGSKITLESGLEVSDFTSYGTTNNPPFSVGNVFNTSLSKIGTHTGTGWLSGFEGGSVNQRLICVFNFPITFDEIRINNIHESGASTDAGAKNVVITISDDVITDTTYNAAISNSEIIFDGQFDEHVALDVEDEQILVLGESPIADITGTVKEQGSFVQRTVRLYKRSDGALISETQSDSEDGSFSLSGTESDTEYYVIVLDDIEDETDFNALIYDRIAVS